MTAELTLQEQIAELQRQLEQKQQEAHDAKIKRQVELQNALRAAQGELDELEAEIGIDTQQRPIVRQQRRVGAHAGGPSGANISTRLIAALKRAGKPLGASDIATLAGMPGYKNTHNLLRHEVKKGNVRRGGEKFASTYLWVGGAQ